jgi:nucleoside-diphosphate-sugar epimerase
MYGEASDAPKKEDSTLNPLTAYARSKVLTEQDLRPLADKNFKVTCLRFATACGMSPRLRLDLVLNDFVACALLFRKITILSDGTPWRPLINIKDMARAIDWAISRPDSIGEFLAINTGTTSWNYQVKDLAEAVSTVVPGVEISINPDAPADKRSYRVDFSLFEKLAPNHQPQHDLISTVKEVKEGLEHMNFSDVSFRNSGLIRLKVITNLQDKGKINNNLEWVA